MKIETIELIENQSSSEMNIKLENTQDLMSYVSLNKPDLKLKYQSSCKNSSTSKK